MPRIIDCTEATSLSDTDVLLVDGDSGSRKITVPNLGVATMGAISPMNHRNILRKKSLGSSVTSAQQTAISDGTFDDLS